jgi:hypothetical protein
MQFCHQINMDEVFGTDRSAKLSPAATRAARSSSAQHRLDHQVSVLRRTDARHVIACGGSARPSLSRNSYFQTMTDWFVILGTSLLALVVVLLFVMVLLGPPTLG